MTVRRDGERIVPRPGAPEQRPPARFHAADRAGSYSGPVTGGTCGCCRLADRRRGPMNRRELRCGIAVQVAREEGRSLPNQVSWGRPACSRFRPAGKRR